MQELSYLDKFNPSDLVVFWIDLFSGAGGTTSGIERAQANAIVVACVNHSATAIASHTLNHPNCCHFVEDIRDFNVVVKIKKIVDYLREKFPHCIINLHASLECTNYSKAKGGKPKDADSRTLANHLEMYVQELDPDYLWIENVREFMSWGPLDENGRPISKHSGSEYIKWLDMVQSYGYNFDYRILNAADFGGRQTRVRYFGQFAKKHLPIVFPVPTHSKEVKKHTSQFHLFDDTQQSLKKWLPVKDILRLDIEGESIFARKKPLVEATLKRILSGLHKFVYNQPPTFVKCENFLCSYYGKGTSHSINSPIGTITTKDRYSLVFPFIDEQYGNGTAKSIMNPIGTITAVPKQRIVQVSKSYLMNPQYSSKGGDINKPCFTLIARMDKAPPYLMTAQNNYSSKNIEIKESDSETMKEIKSFMLQNKLTDIKMRMLLDEELLQIQGFPKNYSLTGTSADRKKQIGNAVHTNVQKAVTEANYEALVKYHHFKKSA